MSGAWGELPDCTTVERRFPITLRIDDRYRQDPASVGRILVTSPGGDRIPLARLAKITQIEGPTTINREWGKRRIVIQANVRDRDVGGYVKDAMAAIDRQVDLPPGYYVGLAMPCRGGQCGHSLRAPSALGKPPSRPSGVCR